jgi:hypothetical protein
VKCWELTLSKRGLSPRFYNLYNADSYIQLSDDPAACYDAGRSYFECFIDAECGTADFECLDEYAAFEVSCLYREEGSQ